ncbi:hypothetical protein F2P79_020123 [Pimephales promelas]|nr:hypothetical protein F2P79_020123 [Pimephales promelas]
MALIGRVEEFKESREDFASYLERFELWLEANEIKAEKQPKPLVIAERFRFQKRDQKEGESVTDYIVAIRQLSKDCEYGTHLDDALRDRLEKGLWIIKAS